MLIENGAHVCAECHEARLQQWRLEDIEGERQEASWDALVSGFSQSRVR